MRPWKSFCSSRHIRKGKAGHSIGITGDSLTKQQKCNMEPDFAQFTGSTATRRALAACQNSKASWNASGRDGFAACAARSSCLRQLQARRTCQLAELQEQLALAEDDHDQRLVARAAPHQPKPR